MNPFLDKPSKSCNSSATRSRSNRTILRVDGLEERAVPAVLTAPVPAIVASASPALAAPTAVKAQLLYKGFEALVLVKWNATPGATEYRVEVSRDGQPWKSMPAFYQAPKATNFIFWPGADGTYSFRVRAVSGGTVSAPSAVGATKVTIIPLPGARTQVIPDTAYTTVGKSVLVPVVANDVAAVGKLSLYRVQNATNGSAVIENGQVRFTPNAGFVGTATFYYTITDGSSNKRGTGKATVIVGPTAANQPVVSVRAIVAATGEPGATGVAATGLVRFTRTGDLSKPLTVAVEWGGFADSHWDYQRQNPTVTFAAGKSTVDVSIVPVADVWREGTESLTVEVKSGSGYVIDVAKNVAVVSIKDNYIPKLTDPTV